MLTRTLDATFLNGVANSKGVREWLGHGDTVLDLTPLVSNPENVALQCESGGFVAERLAPGLYECHSLFREEGRGIDTYKAMREGLRFLFVETDCMEVVTQVPADNRPARGLALKAGFARAFARGDAWECYDGCTCDVEYMSLSYWAWLRGDDEIEGVGLKFCPDAEPSKARTFGAYLLMCMAGNAAKGTLLFNRWARLTRSPMMPWRM